MSEGDPPYAAGDCAYQGAPGAFSEDAARAMLGADASLVSCRTLDDVFLAVASGRVKCAVVPVANTIAGAVPGLADLMARYSARVTDERAIRVVQALVAPPGCSLAGVRRVHSHPVALAQCARFFRLHPRLTPVTAFDTAGAVAEIVRRRGPCDAAIASARAARLWGAVVLEDAIQDDPDNFTRFVRIEAGGAR